MKIQRHWKLFWHIWVTKIPSPPPADEVQNNCRYFFGGRRFVSFSQTGSETPCIKFITHFVRTNEMFGNKGVRGGGSRGVSKCWVEPIFISCFVACSAGCAPRKTSITTVCCSVLLMVASIISFIEEIDKHKYRQFGMERQLCSWFICFIFTFKIII